jgi:hypothetical protein
MVDKIIIALFLSFVVSSIITTFVVIYKQFKNK